MWRVTSFLRSTLYIFVVQRFGILTREKSDTKKKALFNFLNRFVKLLKWTYTKGVGCNWQGLISHQPNHFYIHVTFVSVKIWENLFQYHTRKGAYVYNVWQLQIAGSSVTFRYLQLSFLWKKFCEEKYQRFCFENYEKSIRYLSSFYPKSHTN